MFCIHQGDDGIERKALLNFVIDKKGLRDWRGIGEASCLNDDIVEFVSTLHQVAEDTNEIATHGAADTAVVHLEDFLIGVDHKFVINADLAAFILNHSNALAVLGSEDVVEKRRFSRAEEACKNGDGDAVCGVHVRCWWLFVGRWKIKAGGGPATRTAASCPQVTSAAGASTVQRSCRPWP